ncbi:hypothetical protein [Haloprofundus marisrubri]|nr:hypothetical protein [Haloprofundus marisrubri]
MDMDMGLEIRGATEPGSRFKTVGVLFGLLLIAFLCLFVFSYV